MVGGVALLFGCSPVGRASDSVVVPTWRLVYWWDGGGLVLWLFVGPARVCLLDFFCSGVWLDLLLSPCPCFISLLCLGLYVLGVVHWWVGDLSCEPGVYVSWSTSGSGVRLVPLGRLRPSSGIFCWPFRGGASFVDLLCFCSVLCFLCLCARLFVCALWFLLGAGLLAFVCGVYCEFVTFPLVSRVRCGTWLYRFLIFAPLLTLQFTKAANRTRSEIST